MKHFVYFLICLLFGLPVFSQDTNSSVALPSDFFAGALESAKSSDDELGTQRLVEVKSSELTPSLSLSTSFKYVNNPEKNSVITRKRDGTTLDLSLMLMMGLGEYGIGDDILATPSIMLMHMRTYNDPVRDFGDEMRLFDVDVQIAGLTIPFVLPDDYTLSIGSTYVRPLSFRDNNKQISFSNTPSISLSKILPLENGDILSIASGFSYTLSNGDTLDESLASSGLPASLITSIVTPSALSASPFDLQNGITHSASISYIKTLTDKITLTPSFNYSKMYYDQGSNDGREDTTYIAGVTASYSVNDWLNITSLANFTSKETNGNLSPEFKDFAGGFTFAVNHSF
ncbi:MAG: hypothetical protein HN548_04400 [Opitutae bacterium]|jgi:hypothetical protein|nr:hypothetical protein [Opitutae bacterium]MBT5716939.1 hypothetical protein [Opitutae bacterium]